MAERRMFAKTIIDSDAFLDMPATSQLLYFHLSMRADDDGFINKPKSIMRMCNCTEDDMRILVTKKFVIPFESGIVVIKHWKIHNYIAKDRYTETKYKEEKDTLELDENKAYTSRIQPVDDCETQVRLGKESIGKSNSIINTMCNSAEPDHAKSPSKKDIDALFESVWKLYPNKKGKGQVSDAKKKKLYEIGYDELARAINRYTKDLQRDAEWRKPQNGSTFFNSGFIDYLDKNYEEPPKVVTSSNKTATELSQFYDMTAEWAEGGNQDE